MTIHDPSLRAALKTLKLTGMLDTLDTRLAQTRGNRKLGHLEFLQVLCEDEIARRETAALARRVPAPASNNTPPSRTSISLSARNCPPAMLRDLAALRWLEAGESVILEDPVGVGRTSSPRHSAITWPDTAATSGSSNARGCSPTSPAGTLIAQSADASANTPAPWS